MKRISNQSTSLNGADTARFNLPSYSKILNFQIEYGQLYILYESDMENITNDKLVIVSILKGLHPPSIVFPDESVYHSTIKNVDSHMDSARSNERNINLTLTSVNEYFHIFVQEIKTVYELRDEKLNDII